LRCPDAGARRPGAGWARFEAPAGLAALPVVDPAVRLAVAASDARGHAGRTERPRVAAAGAVRGSVLALDALALPVPALRSSAVVRPAGSEGHVLAAHLGELASQLEVALERVVGGGVDQSSASVADRMTVSLLTTALRTRLRRGARSRPLRCNRRPQ